MTPFDAKLKGDRHNIFVMQKADFLRTVVHFVNVEDVILSTHTPQRVGVKGAIQVLRNADGGGRVSDFMGKKRYEGVIFNVISVTRGWVGVQFPEK